MNPRTPQLRESEFFEQSLPPDVSVIEKLATMHLQVNEPQFSEEVRFGVMISQLIESFRDNRGNRAEALTSTLLGLNQGIV